MLSVWKSITFAVMNKKVLFCLFALSMMFVTIGTAANKRFTLVIDAGHGGKDHGAPGAYSKEKDLTLKFALAFGRMVERNCPDVKVVYVRKTDIFIPLAERAGIANRNKADLFISIHINAVEGPRKVRGFQTYTLGRGGNSGRRGIVENLEVAKRENAVILLEKDYKQTYQGFDPNSPESNIMFEFIQDKNMERSVELAKMMQHHVCAATGRQDMGAHQDNLAVLRLSSMPGCLLELGFISTPDEEDFMNAAGAPEMYARGIFNAFAQYKNKYFQGLVVPYKAAETVETQLPEIVPESYQKPADQPVVQPEAKNDSAPSTAETQPAETTKPTIPEVRQPVSTPESVVSAPVFKVQILSCSTRLNPEDARFKGISGCESYEENGIIKYTYGSSADYNEMRRIRREILGKFPDAFIIAFQDNRKVDVQQAIRQFLQTKKK